MLMMTVSAFAQLPLEGFETWPPANWTIINATGPTVTWTQSGLGNPNQPPYAGDYAAFIEREQMPDGTTSEDLLVTPQFQVPASPQLRFFSRLTLIPNNSNIYEIRITTDPNPVTATYTTIQTWTEPQINPSPQTYTEKIVNIPASYVGQQVYLAFVMMGDFGDRWLVDNVSVVTQCLDPTTLTASNFTETTASLSWANPSGATSWEIEVVPAAGSPTGTGIVYNGILPYTASGLTQDTDYKYYVRALCTADNPSQWVGPFNFSTVATGAVCSAPIVINALPFSATNNTTNFGDDFDGVPGNGCGTTGTFLNGDEVVYAYPATFTGVISVNMTGNGANSAMFVYNSCANIGVSCVAGGTGNATTPVNLSSVSVISGTTYYIVISSSTTQSTPYTLTIQQVNCPPPTGLTATNMNATSANLTWNANAATSWQVFVQTAGAGIPAGAGTTTAVNTNYNVTQTTAGVLFAPATSYEYYVRADCGAGDGTFSAWTGPFAFMTTQVPVALPYTEGFEGASGWSMVNGTQVAKWVVGTAVNNGGTQALYISQDNGVTNTYPTGGPASSVHAYRDIQMPSPVGQISLSFDWKSGGENGWDYMRVWSVPTTFVPIAGTQITAANSGGTQIGGDLTLNHPNWTTANFIIDASAFAGQVRRIVFEWRHDTSGGTGIGGAIDNVNISQITCSSPSALAVSGATQTTANVSWTPPGVAPASYDYYVSTTNTAPTAATVPTGNVTAATAPLTGLIESTTYYVWVRSNCGATDGNSFWVGPVQFNTLCGAFNVPFFEGFNSTSATEFCWTVLNSNGDGDAWNMNYATNPFEGNQAAAITTDFNNGANNDWLISPTINLTGNQRLRYRYRVQSAGEPDAFEVLLSTAGVDPVSFTTTLVPLATYGNTTYVEVIVNLLNGGTPISGPVNIAWHVPAGGPDGWRLYVDNVIVEDIPTCPDPTALTVLSTTTTTAQLGWTAGFNETAWQVVVQPQGTGAPTGTSTILAATTNPYTATGLNPSTQYEYYVRANCGVGDLSNWVGPFTFTTLCDAFNVPFFEGFNSTSTTEFCWTVLNSNGDGDAWNMNYATNPYEGNQVATLTTDFNNGANNDWLISPTINLTGNQRLRYRYRVQSTFEPDAFEVLVSTAGIAPANFTIQLVPLATYSNTTYVEVIINLLNGATPISGPVNIAWHVPAGGPDGWRLYVDNVIVEDIPTCPDPTNLVVLGTTTSTAQLQWTPGFTETAWQVVVQPQGTGLPTGTSTILDATTNPYTATGLSPYTQYEYYVRANCGIGDLSNWVGPIAFTTSIGNDDCEGAVTLPVNPTADCALTVPATFTGATASPQANPCTGVNGGDIWFEFTATGPAHDISLSDFGGTAQPIVLSLYEGDVCGTLTNLMCSYTNVINATGLVSGTTYKVRAVLNSATPSLNTTFDVCVNTPPPPANSNQTECIITTINYDFELPEPPAPTIYPHFVSHHVVQGWRTTATDQQMEFWSAPNYENVPAYSGDQFIELNANLVSGVYQDYQTPQVTEFSYGFAHRGRQGTDTCQLLAGPPGGPYVPVTTATTGNTAWVYYTGTYTVPVGQTVTRFIFQSVSSVGGASVGNYLDAITFTANNGLLSENPMLLDCANNIANVSAAGVGTWSAHADNPGATVIASPGSNDTTIAGFSAAGIYRYDWTTQYCTSTLEVTFDSIVVPAPVATAEVFYCTGDVAVTLTADVLAGNTLNWYVTETGGTPLAGAPTPDTATAGSTIYYVSQTSPEGCESPRTAISVTVNDVPAAPVATDVQYCAGDTATPLTATVATGNTLNWYTTETGGTALAGAPTPDTATANTTNYYVSQVAQGGCESTRTEVTVTVNAVFVPVTGFTYASPVCSAAGNILPETAIGFTTGGTFTANGITVDPVTGEIDMATAGEGDFVITYEVLAAGTCSQGGTTNFTITINNSVVPVTGFDFDASYCHDVTGATPSTVTGFTTGGMFTATGGLSINAVTGAVDLSSAQPGEYTVTYTIAPDVANCNPGGSSSDTFTVGAESGFTLVGDCQDNEYVISLPTDFDPAGATYEWINAAGASVGSERTFNVTEYVAGTPETDVFPLDFMLIVSIDGCESSSTHTVDGISCNIQKGISPGDGDMNDYFDLSGLEVKSISIFNRYGQEVYTYGNYTNQWVGQDKKGNELPTGTYFYSFERSNGETKTGWIYINRQN
jgi:large repetitive protein